MSTIVAQVCMYNEMEKGNLRRCLNNLKQYCDEIVIYDDASTDDSVLVAREYTNHIIQGTQNNQMQELLHKQIMLDYSIRLGATHTFWLDCDEVLERKGTEGGLRNLCDNWPKGIDAFSFRELNLWRSQRWVRTDSLFAFGRFVRLWKIVPGISFHVIEGVHKQLYPRTIRTYVEAPFGVIHYGFHDYKKMLVKIGAHGWTKEDWLNLAADNWILNETECNCYYAPDEMFPVECVPTGTWEQPMPKNIDELQPYCELEE